MTSEPIVQFCACGLFGGTTPNRTSICALSLIRILRNQQFSDVPAAEVCAFPQFTVLRDHLLGVSVFANTSHVESMG